MTTLGAMGGPRPARLVVVAGTDTEIGKTWVTVAVADTARRAGLTVAARKPLQSFAPEEADAGETDAHLLAAATGEALDAVCPADGRFPVPLAPPMAAAVLGRPVPRLDGVLDALHWPDPPVDLGLVEPAGGVRSPLTDDADTVGLCRALSPDRVVLVAHAGLGTINAVRLSAEALAPWPTTVLLNRFDERDDLHRRNAAWLARRDGLDVAVDVADLVSRLAGPDPGAGR